MAKPFSRALLIPVAAIAIALGAMSAGAAVDGAVVQRADVSPSKGFTGAARGVRIEFRLSGEGGDVTIKIAGGGREVRRIEQAGADPGNDEVEIWDGLDNSGRLVRDGTYRVIVAVAGGNEKEAGSVLLRGHFFPVRAPHGTRGAVGEFRAPRSGGRWHKGFDITASCGTPLAAARTGVVVRRAFDPRLDGNFIVIKGFRERRWYWYSHMAHLSHFRKGDLVRIGEIVGHIGRSGNAGSTPCHLHFELHQRGRPIDPEPSLRAWDRYS
jgi:murein DD-endopeptidase MepM/ murein hydrolase activator NlpD